MKKEEVSGSQILRLYGIFGKIISDFKLTESEGDRLIQQPYLLREFIRQTIGRNRSIKKTVKDTGKKIKMAHKSYADYAERKPQKNLRKK